MFPTILIVDDELSICQSLAGLLSDEGFETMTALNGYEALKIIADHSPDLVLLDIWMHGIDGIETLKEIKKNHPYIQVIMITGHGRIDTAVTAIKLGAYDFIEKPLSIDRVIVAINNALNFRRLEEENKYLRKKTIERHSITGNSKAALALKKDIITAAPTDAWILITGENGTGKELVANSIHLLSSRANNPMIDVNCAAISNEYVDIELFGRESEGSFGKKIGKFELANYGTLFFDEIGDMNLETQGKILRVLQEKQFTRVGGSRKISIDIRIIASTNKDIAKEIEAGNFREDLYYRLNVIPIAVPPLRERTEDIQELSEYFLNEYAKKIKFPKKRITKVALQVMKSYPWPGNIRELKNFLERLSITVKNEKISKSDIQILNNKKSKSELSETDFFKFKNFKKAKLSFENRFIKKNVEERKTDISENPKKTGISKNRLAEKVKKVDEKEKQD